MTLSILFKSHFMQSFNISLIFFLFQFLDKSADLLTGIKLTTKQDGGIVHGPLTSDLLQTKEDNPQVGNLRDIILYFLSCYPPSHLKRILFGDCLAMKV